MGSRLVIKQGISEVRTTTISIGVEGDHKVYVVRDSNTKEVIYIGRTIRELIVRWREHSRITGREEWNLELIEDNLSYDEARFWEQELINRHGGIDNLENKINAVASDLWQILVDMFR